MIAGFGAVTLGLAVTTRGIGFSVRGEPSGVEARLAYAVRGWLMPPGARAAANAVVLTPEVLESGMAHWADHCATCHANDGSGDTAIGRSLYPPAPDMRRGRSQQMTDGELFYVIERGIPFTGMPAWGTGTAEGERLSWELVRFIRHLPSLTASDITKMEQLNPKSALRPDLEKQMRDFLKGGR